ncbi:MAG: hypothetical protein PHV54_13390 [Tolumonas sp.]|nr:hypothetical protein [Tolumonas sp.]
MADIWLHRKQELIRVINQVTDTDYDDLDMSVVLNVLWTADDEERDYLNSALKSMISGSFDDISYSRSFLEQLDLICGVPIAVADDDEESEHEEEQDTEEIESEDEFIEEKTTNLAHSWLICLISLSVVLFSLYLNKDSFNKEAMLDILPKWPYFWAEFALITAGLISVAYIIKSIVNGIAEYVATIGYLLLFMPLLCILKGFTFSSSLWLYFCVIFSIVFMTTLSRICSRKTVGQE